MAKLRLREVYSTGAGLAVSAALKMLLHTSKFDYILCDSRTGYAEISGICAKDLADGLVVVSGLNSQNVEGTRRVLEDLELVGSQAEKARPLVLAMGPVPELDLGLREERMAKAREEFGFGEDQWDDVVFLPYHPRVSLSEEPFVTEWPHESLSERYRQLSYQVRAMAGDGPRQWVERFETSIRDDKHDDARTAVFELVRVNRAAAVQNLRGVTVFATRNPSAFPEGGSPYFRKLLELDPGDHIALYNWGNALGALARAKAPGAEQEKLFAEALAKYSHAIELNPGFSEALFNAGALFEECSQLAEAARHFQRSALTFADRDILGDAENAATRCAGLLPRIREAGAEGWLEALGVSLWLASVKYIRDGKVDPPVPEPTVLDYYGARLQAAAESGSLEARLVLFLARFLYPEAFETVSFAAGIAELTRLGKQLTADPAPSALALHVFAMINAVVQRVSDGSMRRVPSLTLGAQNVDADPLLPMP